MSDCVRKVLDCARKVPGWCQEGVRMCQIEPKHEHFACSTRFASKSPNFDFIPRERKVPDVRLQLLETLEVSE